MPKLQWELLEVYGIAFANGWVCSHPYDNILKAENVTFENKHKSIMQSITGEWVCCNAVYDTSGKKTYVGARTYTKLIDAINKET